MLPCLKGGETASNGGYDWQASRTRPDVEFSEESAFVDVALRSGEASMVLKVRNASASAISDANRILDEEWIPLFVRNYLRIIADELSDIDRTSLEGQASCNDRGGNPSGGGTTSRSDASGYFVKMGSLDSAWIAAPPRWRSVLIGGETDVDLARRQDSVHTECGLSRSQNRGDY